MHSVALAGDTVADLEVASRLFQPNYPAAWAVDGAAATLRDRVEQAAGVSLRRAGLRACGELREGPHALVEIAPGGVRFMRRNVARGERTRERQDDARRKVVDQAAAAAIAGQLGPLDPFPVRQRITEWSGKSRANMVWRLLTLDYTPLSGLDLPAMVTWTLPADWQRYAPTGRAWKLLLRRWTKRFVRAWRRPLVGIWKLEFQGRGAPHQHALMCPPRGLSRDGRVWRDWFAETWADVIGVEGADRQKVIAVHRHPTACADYAEGLRASDPRRIAVYFLKHNTAGPGSKEYQHRVPVEWQGEGDGPGRFWGVWGLENVGRRVELTLDQAVRVARVARKWDRAARPVTVDQDGNVAGGVRRVSVQRVDRRTGVVRRRTVKRRVGRLGSVWGFLAANDGPALALALSEVLTV